MCNGDASDGGRMMMMMMMMHDEGESVDEDEVEGE